MLLRLKLVVEDKLHTALLVNDVSLATRQRAEEVAGNAPVLAQPVALVTQQREWQPVLGLERLPSHHIILDMLLQHNL